MLLVQMYEERKNEKVTLHVGGLSSSSVRGKVHYGNSAYGDKRFGNKCKAKREEIVPNRFKGSGRQDTGLKTNVDPTQGYHYTGAPKNELKRDPAERSPYIKMWKRLRARKRKRLPKNEDEFGRHVGYMGGPIVVNAKKQPFPLKTKGIGIIAPGNESLYAGLRRMKKKLEPGRTVKYHQTLYKRADRLHPDVDKKKAYRNLKLRKGL